MSSKNIDLFIIAAEPSADKHGFEIARALLRQNPNLIIAGVLGPKMRTLPIQCIMPMEKLQVMGFIDVLLSFAKLAFHFFSLRKTILKLHPKALLFIDYPEFNLRLERSLKKKRYKGKIFHHVCPTVWAWAKKRVHIMNDGIDHLFVVFPFEKKYVEGFNFSVSYVGHPLAQAIDSHDYQTITSSSSKKILSIFPGSRTKEILRNFPIQLKCANTFLKEDLDLQLTISYSDEKKKELIESTLRKQNISSYSLCPSNQNYDLMKISYAAIATSGTITLELAIHRVPTVVTFFIQFLDLMIAQKILKIDLPFFSIVNIICQSTVFPELFGPNLTKNSIHFWVGKILNDQSYREKIISQCTELKSLFQNMNPTQEIMQKISSEIG